MEKPRWQVRSSSYVIDSPYMRVRCDEVALPDGTVIDEYYVRESDGFTFVFPVTPGGTVVLTEQYRYGADDITIELPAGNVEPGEDPRRCAQRELLEETGYEAREFRLLGTYYAEPVRSRSRCIVYAALDARKVADQNLDATECIRAFEVSFDELRALVTDGRMNSLGSVAAALLGLRALGR